MSFRFSFIDVFINDSDILVEAEDRTCKEERLRHIVEQPSCHIVDFEHLVRHVSFALQRYGKCFSDTEVSCAFMDIVDDFSGIFVLRRAWHNVME